MMEIDGSTHSGSGTLLRHAAALATLLRQPLHMVRIRAKREKPGLRAQHLQVVRACCSLCNGELHGDQLGSSEITYRPGKALRNGEFQWDIGTAGSTTMLAFTLIPLALFAPGPCRLSFIGGLFQDFAPSAFHMQNLLIPLLRRMGADIRMEILRPGYPPKGQGKMTLETKPLLETLKPIHLTEQGEIGRVRGIAMSSHLEREKVSERMADHCQTLLRAQGLKAEMQVLNDHTAAQRGAALLLWAETQTGGFIGADQAGKPGRRSESMAEFVVTSFLEDLGTKAALDRYLADQLIVFAALASGRTQVSIPRVTDHVRSNLWLVEKFLETKATCQGNQLVVEGIGLRRK
jgi:RNA 3'-terminal phosphate cyclase (ATP)